MEPGAGVFLSVDEYEYQDSNSTLWGWPNQNPARFRDPSGRSGRDPSLPLPLGPLLCMKYTPVAREYCCKKTCEAAYGEWGQAVLDCRAVCDRDPPNEWKQCPTK